MDPKLNDMFRAAPQSQVTGTIKPLFPSFVERTQYSDFHFNKEQDANRFARSYSGKQPNKDFLKGTWVVRL